jgi:hypothetical protein
MQDEDHFIVALVRSLAKVGTTERFILDAHAEAVLEKALIDFADDPGLPRAVVGLFELAKGLEDAGCGSAAGVILSVLARVHPRLTAFAPARDEAMQAAAESFQELTGSKQARVAIDRLPPEGSLKVSALSEFGGTRRKMRG